jgi:hypothetical protein
VPKQATLSIRPAHCSIFGHAQSPNPIFTGRYSSVDQAEAAFYVWYGILPSPTATDPDREAADRIYSILLDQISLNRPMGIYPDGLHPAAVQAEHSPAMPADHEPWSTPPHVPFELTTARTCFLVTVAHDTPAAMALYAMASNQAPLHPIHHSPHRHLQNRHPPRLPTTPRHTSPRLPPSGDRPQTVGRVPGLHLPLRCRVMAAPATSPGPGTPKHTGQEGQRGPAPFGHQPGAVTP